MNGYTITNAATGDQSPVILLVLAALVAAAAICLILFLKKRSDARKAGEQVVPLDPNELEAKTVINDKANVAETGSQPDDAQEDN